jgi:alpha-L-fucosidase 2
VGSIPDLPTVRLRWKEFCVCSGVHELLLQGGRIYRSVFSNTKDWKNVSFDNLRAEGAVLVSGRVENEKLITVKLFSEKGGVLNVSCLMEKIQLAESKMQKQKF